MEHKARATKCAYKNWNDRKNDCTSHRSHCCRYSLYFSGFNAPAFCYILRFFFLGFICSLCSSFNCLIISHTNISPSFSPFFSRQPHSCYGFCAWFALNRSNLEDGEADGTEKNEQTIKNNNENIWIFCKNERAKRLLSMSLYMLLLTMLKSLWLKKKKTIIRDSSSLNKQTASLWIMYIRWVGIEWEICEMCIMCYFSWKRYFLLLQFMSFPLILLLSFCCECSRVSLRLEFIFCSHNDLASFDWFLMIIVYNIKRIHNCKWKMPTPFRKRTTISGTSASNAIYTVFISVCSLCVRCI